MARAARNDTLSTRTRRLRLRLPARREPRWMRLSKGCHLGYRKLADGSGTWIAKLRDDATGARHYRALGAADDIRDADGLTVFAFAHAQAAARAWFERKSREIAGVDGAEAATGTTVADAMAAYLGWYRLHRKPSGYATACAAIETHTLPALGSVPLARLTAARIRQWHEELAASAPMVRKARGATGPAYREASGDPEARRKRCATANRVLTVLKAALNRAFADGKVAGDDAWRRVKPFRGADAARVRYLSDDEARRLATCCCRARTARHGGGRTSNDGSRRRVSGLRPRRQSRFTRCVTRIPRGWPCAARRASICARTVARSFCRCLAPVGAGRGGGPAGATSRPRPGGWCDWSRTGNARGRRRWSRRCGEHRRLARSRMRSQRSPARNRAVGRRRWHARRGASARDGQR